MWRAMFLAIGIMLLIVGAECLGVEKAVLRLHNDPPPPSAFQTEPPPATAKEVNPPPWAPWSLMATGAVVCLYSFTLPKRISGN